MVVDIHPAKGLAEMFVAPATKNFPRVINIEGVTEDFIDVFTDQLREDMAPILDSDHVSHLDGWVLPFFCNLLTNISRDRGVGRKLRGWTLPVAASLEYGQQGILQQLLYQASKPYINELGVHSFPVTRKKDEDKYKMVPKKTEAIPFLRGLEQNFGIALLAGGSVEPGRSNGEGGVKGLQPIVDDDLRNLYKLVTHRSRRNPYNGAFFQPVAVWGKEKLFSPDTLFLTKEGFVSLYLREATQEDWNFEPEQINVRAGMPMTQDYMASVLGSNWPNDSQGINTVVVNGIARLLPPEYQGVYRAGILKGKL
jgi:hypothetical protein